MYADQFEQFDNLNIHPLIDQKHIIITHILLDTFLTDKTPRLYLLT